MKNYIIKRILWMVPILIGISFFAFILINLSERPCEGGAPGQ